MRKRKSKHFPVPFRLPLPSSPTFKSHHFRKLLECRPDMDKSEMFPQKRQEEKNDCVNFARTNVIRKRKKKKKKMFTNTLCFNILIGYYWLSNICALTKFKTYDELRLRQTSSFRFVFICSCYSMFCCTNMLAC